MQKTIILLLFPRFFIIFTITPYLPESVLVWGEAGYNNIRLTITLLKIDKLLHEKCLFRKILKSTTPNPSGRF